MSEYLGNPFEQKKLEKEKSAHEQSLLSFLRKYFANKQFSSNEVKSKWNKKHKSRINVNSSNNLSNHIFLYMSDELINLCNKGFIKLVNPQRPKGEHRIYRLNE